MIFHIPQSGPREPDWKGSEAPPQGVVGLPFVTAAPQPRNPELSGSNGAWGCLGLGVQSGLRWGRLCSRGGRQRATSRHWMALGSGVLLWRQRGHARRLQKEVAVPGLGARHLTAGGGRSWGSQGLRGGPCESVCGGGWALGGEKGSEARAPEAKRRARGVCAGRPGGAEPGPGPGPPEHVPRRTARGAPASTPSPRPPEACPPAGRPQLTCRAARG